MQIQKIKPLIAAPKARGNKPLGNQFGGIKAEQIKTGDQVRVISGPISELTGTVVRCEKQGTCLIAVPDQHSAVLFRVPRAGVRRLQAH